eukprot:753572-Hanusia_phi.AAC.11
MVQCDRLLDICHLGLDLRHQQQQTTTWLSGDVMKIGDWRLNRLGVPSEVVGEFLLDESFFGLNASSTF